MSNFGLAIIASVHVTSDAGGPGLLLKTKRYPDNVEKYTILFIAYMQYAICLITSYLLYVYIIAIVR